jgi:selenide,water dikinase
VINYSDVPILESAKRSAGQFVFPDITTKNFQNIQPKISPLNGEQLLVLCDPQTSGGLLVTFHENSLNEMKSLCALHNETLTVIGRLQEAKEICVEVV